MEVTDDNGNTFQQTTEPHSNDKIRDVSIHMDVDAAQPADLNAERKQSAPQVAAKIGPDKRKANKRDAAGNTASKQMKRSKGGK